MDSSLIGQLIFEHASDAYFLLNRLQIVSCNQAALKLLGICSVTEIQDKSPIDFAPDQQPDGRSSRQFIIQQLKTAQTQQHSTFEWVMQDVKARSFWTDVKLNALPSEDQPLVLAIVQDIQGQKDKEQAAHEAKERMQRDLRRKEKYFRSLIENSQEGIAISTKDRQIIYSSPSITRIFGLQCEDYLDSDWLNRVHDDYKKDAIKKFQEALQQPATPVKTEYFYRHQNGKWLLLEVIFNNLLHNSAVRGVIINYRNVTQRAIAERFLKKYNQTLEHEVKEKTDELQQKNQRLEEVLQNLKEAQAQLVQSEKMASLGQLTAGVAHEINNPINFLSGSIGPLKRDLEDLVELVHSYEREMKAAELQSYFSQTIEWKEEIDVDFLLEEIDDLLKGMEEGASRTAKIVQGLRVFSRLDENERKIASVHEGIESTLQILHSRIKHRIQIHKNFANLPPILCYPGQLNQVFMNLLTNAIQAIQEEGNIWIQTQIRAQELDILIRDDGVGIPEEVLPNIFTPFFTTKDVGKGTGLGLSISFGIIEKHGGKIEVESKVGEGTSFRILLPIEGENQAS